MTGTLFIMLPTPPTPSFSPGTFTFIYHCDVITHGVCIATRFPRKAALTGDADLIADNSASKIIWYNCYDLNDHGRMEIDHVFVSGALVGRATTHSWGRPSPCCMRSDRQLTQKRGQFLQHSVKCCGLMGNPAIRFLLPSVVLMVAYQAKCNE